MIQKKNEIVVRCLVKSSYCIKFSWEFKCEKPILIWSYENYLSSVSLWKICQNYKIYSSRNRSIFEEKSENIEIQKMLF